MKHTPQMSKLHRRRVGRPKVTADSGESITLRVDAAKLRLADELAEGLDQMVPGLRHSRGDVLRAALSRGLDAISEDIDARTKR
jgi:hypothetical protein